MLNFLWPNSLAIIRHNLIKRWPVTRRWQLKTTAASTYADSKTSRARLVFCLVLFVTTSGAVRAQESADRLVIGYPSAAAINSPLWVAQDAGIFRAHNLKTELIFILGGVRIIQGVVSGALQVGWGGGPATLSAVLAGADIKVIAALNEMVPYKLVVQKNIARPEQLKGQRIAISRPGDTSDFGASLALRRLGMSSDDMIRIGAGTDMERLIAMERGGAQAAIVEMVTGLIAEKRGHRVLVDLTTGPERMLGSGIVVKIAFIERHPEVCRELLKAIVEAIHFLKTKPDESKRIIARRMRIDDPQLLETHYTLQALNRVLIKPIPSDEGIRTALEFVSLTNPKAKGASVDQFVDLRLIRELDKSGYIDALWRKK